MLARAILFSLLLVLGSRIADAGVTNVSVATYSGPVTLGEQAAVWGLSQNTSLTPIPGSYSGVQMTNVNPNGLPLLALGQFQQPEYQFVNTSGTFYGGLQHNGQGFPYEWSNGTGFELAFTPENETTYEVYLLSYLGSSSAVIYYGEEVQGYVDLPSMTPSKVTFTTDAYTRLFAVMEGADVDRSDASLSIGAVNVVAVPEPEYWLAGIILLAGAAMYWMIVYGTVLFVGKSDGDERP